MPTIAENAEEIKRRIGELNLEHRDLDRAIEALENGYRPTILIRGAGDSKDPPKGFIGKAMGRIASVSVDDANYPGGVIIIDDGFVKW